MFIKTTIPISTVHTQLSYLAEALKNSQLDLVTKHFYQNQKMLSIIFFLVNIFSLLPTITLGNPLPLPPLSQIPQTSPIPAAENDNLQALDYDNVDTAQDYDQLWSTVSGLLSDDIPEKNLFFDMCVLKEVSVLQCLCFSSWLTVDKTRF